MGPSSHHPTTVRSATHGQHRHYLKILTPLSLELHRPHTSLCARTIATVTTCAAEGVTTAKHTPHAAATTAHRYTPVGVVVAVLTWNFPLLNLGYKVTLRYQPQNCLSRGRSVVYTKTRHETHTTSVHQDLYAKMPPDPNNLRTPELRCACACRYGCRDASRTLCSHHLLK